MAEIEQQEASPGASGPGEARVAAPATPPVVQSRARSDGLIAWAVLSIAFLAYIAFGSVEARIWRFNNLRIEPRSVLRVWTLQAETLPRVAQQWLLTSLFYACLLTIIVGAVIGIWLLLDSAGTGFSRFEPDAESDQDGV